MVGEIVVAGELTEPLLAGGVADTSGAEGVAEFVERGCPPESGSTLEETLCTVTGPVGLVVIAVYSFLIAVALPFPAELVLAPVGEMRLGLSTEATVALVILVSATAKTLGSLVAFHLGQEAKRAGPVVRWLRRSRFDVLGWSKRRSVVIARKYGYLGLALLLSIPGFPHTVPIYAYAVLDDDYHKFALATFVGSAVRLVIAVSVVGGVIVLS